MLNTRATSAALSHVTQHPPDRSSKRPEPEPVTPGEAYSTDTITRSRKRKRLTDGDLIRLEQQHGAPICNPLPIVFSRGKGPYLFDRDDKRYLDLVTGYSVISQGHANPRILEAMNDQAAKLSLTSRIVHNDQLPQFLKKLSEVTGYEQAIPMNSGAEAVETAIKLARRHGYRTKHIPENQAEIVVCNGNFHGRTLSAVSMSSDAEYRHDFGPFVPNMIRVPYGDAAALEKALTKNTAAIIVEPVQGEAGIIVPPEGYLQQLYRLTRKHQVLFIADEIQTGFGRTGKLFAYQHAQGVRPDVLLLGKALGGGVYPISAVVSSKEIMRVFEPGSHGSTYGGNPLAAAIGTAALREYDDGRLVRNAHERGKEIMSSLKALNSTLIREVRGKGLFIGVELTRPARPVAEALLQRERIFTKDTHGATLRIAPVLSITKRQAATIAPAFQRVLKSFEKN